MTLLCIKQAFMSVSALSPPLLSCHRLLPSACTVWKEGPQEMLMCLKHAEMEERVDLNVCINRQAPATHMNFPPLLREKPSLYNN